MTKVAFDYGLDNLEIRAEGHATGSEQVCASVSTLTLSLLGYAINAQRRGDVLISQQLLEPGRFYLRASGNEQLRGAFEMTRQGMMQLEKSFPEYVTITTPENFEKSCDLGGEKPCKAE